MCLEKEQVVVVDGLLVLVAEVAFVVRIPLSLNNIFRFNQTYVKRAPIFYDIKQHNMKMCLLMHLIILVRCYKYKFS